MIDYLISYQNGQIWINLELHFESYDFFLIFRDFSIIFLKNNEFNSIYFELIYIYIYIFIYLLCADVMWTK